MKLLHSIACVLIGYSALASVAPGEALADRVIEVDPAISAALRFGRYTQDVNERVQELADRGASMESSLQSALAGTTGRSQRRQLVKLFKQAWKIERDQCRDAISALSDEAKQVLSFHAAGIALYPAIDGVKQDAFQRINEIFQDSNRSFDAALR